MTGYSSVIPFAPRIVLACLAMSMAVRTLAIFARLTCSGVSGPASLSRPRCRASNCALVRSANIHASLPWVSWKLPIGLPNCSLVRAYSTAVSRQDLADPSTPQAMPYLASVRHDSGPLSPDTPGSIASAGSLTSSKLSSAVTEARSDIFLWMLRVVNPRAPRGTRNPRIPSGVRAQTTAMSAMDPFVIHILEPERTQPVPLGLALVFMPPGSEPWSGSVRPKQPSASPVAILGSHSSFCSSEPYRQIGYMASEPCTDTMLRRPVSAASSSRQATP